MEFVYKLFAYNFMYYSQGTEEWSTSYALLYVPKDACFNNNRSTLIAKRHQDHYHEIDIDSVEDLTINF